MPVYASSSLKSRLRLVGAVVLLVVGIALVVTPIVGVQQAKGGVSDGTAAVERATNKVSLLKSAAAKATSDLVAADEERESAEFIAVISKSSRSFFIGTLATKQSVQEDYDQAMQAAADAHDRIADKVDAAGSDLASAERELSLENDDLASQMKAMSQAESVVWIFASIGGAIILAAAGLSAWAVRTRSAQNAI